MARFKDVFSIIGPAMVGPSSSHTAGAVRIGRSARILFQKMPAQAEIVMFGSFAETGKGHGTDAALIGGLLQYETDDLRIPDAIEHAKQLGMEIHFSTGKGHVRHPNTVKLRLSDEAHSLTVTGSSIGGGNIEITEVNGFNVQFTSVYPTIVMMHDDRPGLIAEVTNILSKAAINIGHMDVDRKGRNREAMTVIEVDSPLSTQVLDQIRALSRVHEVVKVDLAGVKA